MNKVILFLSLLISSDTFAQEFQYFRKGERVIEQSNTANNNDVSSAERFNIHFQTTYIYQYKPAFVSHYKGPNSLSGKEDKENSLTATLYMGARLWKGAEIYVNPEVAGGSGLSGALGMGGSSNGETFRVGNPAPSLYLARAYYKQTFTLRDKMSRKNGVLNTTQVESDANQLAGYDPKNYLRFYAGKFCLGDIFDNNEYSNSPRTQFMNWALMNNGAWDYAANVRGYTLSFATELQLGKMNYKLAIAALPTEANGAKLNTDLAGGYALNAEITRDITIRNKPGHIRLLAYYNTTYMGSYANAIGLANVYKDTPDVETFGNPTRDNKPKLGFGLNFDQQLNNTFGVFSRIGWNDGKNQTWCYTEIDQTVSLGLSANGNIWNRKQDNCGVALVANGLSQDHRRYLALGGSGFILGDGQLNYAPEFITELYYSYKPADKGIWISGDYQFCINPGFNADRGPVNIFSLRLHVEL